MEATKFRISEKIGPNMGWTDEKFLICYAVPISRTGVLIYGPNERPEIPPGDDGLVHIERHEEDVFDPESIASLQGKPLVNEHPADDVSPENWATEAKGTFDDCVVADIIVMDADAIKDVLAGKREVSAGYDPQYFVLGPGRGVQRRILYNHVALVESGRCGPRCSIHDHAMPKEKNSMKKPKWLDNLRGLRDSLTQDKRGTFDEAIEEAEKETKDAEAEEAERRCRETEDRRRTKDDDLSKRLEELEAKHEEHGKKLETHDSDIAELKERIGEKETKDSDEAKTDKDDPEDLKEEAPIGSGDSAMKSKDSAFMVSSWQHTLTMAEIIAPGIRIPTFDSKAAPKVSYQGICDFRKRALSLALLTADTNKIIEDVRAGRTLDSAGLLKLSCPEVRTLFFATGAAVKARNTQDATTAGTYTSIQGAGGGLGVKGTIKTPADLNRVNHERYNGK
jgi:hypothetical protein